MQNLRDKLMKAGLVSNEQAEAAQKQESAPPPRSTGPSGPPAPGGGRPDGAREASRGGLPHASRDRPSGASRSRPSDASRSSARGGYSADRRPPPRDGGAGSGYQVPVVRAGPPVPKLAPLPGSVAHQRLEALKQQEIDQQLRAMVQAGQVEAQLGEQTFYFQTRKGKLRRLNLSPEQAALLEKGELAVVERQEPAAIEHSLVPAEAAEKMLALFPRSVRFFNKPGAPVGFVSESDVQAATLDSGPETPGLAQTASEPTVTPVESPTEPEGG